MRSDRADAHVAPDEYGDGRQVWTAAVDWDGSPEYDASGPDPLYAALRLVEELMTALKQATEPQVAESEGPR